MQDRAGAHKIGIQYAGEKQVPHASAGPRKSGLAGDPWLKSPFAFAQRLGFLINALDALNNGAVRTYRVRWKTKV